jgi:hypothetical protein
MRVFNLVIVFAQEGGESGGRMFLFHIEPTGETGIPVCVPLDEVWGVLELRLGSEWSCASTQVWWYERSHSSTLHLLEVWAMWASSAAAAAYAATSSTLASSTPSKINLLPIMISLIGRPVLLLVQCLFWVGHGECVLH